MPLLPERHLLISPQLAATLGLEEALLYQLLADVLSLSPGEARGNLTWYRVARDRLRELLPFWSEQDLRRVSTSLRDKGVLVIDDSPQTMTRDFCFAFPDGQPAHDPTSLTAPGKPRSPTRLLRGDWAPAPDVVEQLGQYGIPPDFIEQQIAEFVTYWTERREPRHSWNAKFLKQVLRLWREEEARNARLGRECIMTGDWQPSIDAVTILVEQAGISRNFVEDAVPEFILYWRERGERRGTWNSDFVRHVKRQWARYTAALEHDSEPRPLDNGWQPSNDLYEVLSLANIPRAFAERELPAFVLFWRENGHATNSWNTKFLQHVKRQWARRAIEGDPSHERRQSTGASVSTRHRSLVDDLTDRSWAG